VAPPDLDRAIPANFTAYLRLFARLPGMELHEEPDITWFACSHGAPGNHVTRTALDPAADPNARLRQVLAEMRAQVARMDWPIYPGDAPPDLDAHLAALGLEEGHGGPWMVADLTMATPAPPLPGFSVRRVMDADELGVWRRVSAEGFEMPFDAIQPYYDAYLQEGFGADAVLVPYLGYHGDEPVTSGTLLCAAGLAGVYDVSTPPRARRRGYGSAITAHMMAEGRARGYRYACLLASSEGERIYRKLGFVLQLRPPEYIWRSS
jgi:GNAT superfamily N-acetyltransferase